MKEERVALYIEGMGNCYSTGRRSGNNETVSVRWVPAFGEWMSSHIQHASAEEVGLALRAAQTSGKVRLERMWCPNGFSGGGVYLKVEGK